MATGQDLRHDFAPAWLKLPNSETAKQNAVKFGERSLDRTVNERSGRSGWYGGSAGGTGGGGAIGGGSGSGSSRGRSAVDDVDYTQQPRRQRFYSSDHPTEYNGSFNGDGQRPRSRHGGGGHGAGRFHDQVNDTAAGTGEQALYAGGGGSSSGLRSPVITNGLSGYSGGGKYHADGRSGSMPETSRGSSRRSKSVREIDSVVVTTASLDDEFPSLNGESSVECKKPTVNKVQSVWDSPCREPSTAGSRATATIVGSFAADTAHKALVLKTGGLTKRGGGGGGGGLNDVDRTSGSRSLAIPFAQKLVVGVGALRDASKESVVGDVLNTCLVKQPKNLVDKKSSFLKALRRESHELAGPSLPSAHRDGDLSDERRSASSTSPPPPSVMNGDSKMLSTMETASDTSENVGNSVESLETDDMMLLRADEDSSASDVFHPSFTEAEYRLLQEMGWKEQDDDEDGYEITEAEVREFENLCRQLKMNKSNHPALSHHNGFSKTSSPSIAGLPRLSSGFMADVSLPYLRPNDDDDGDSSDSSDGASNANPH